MKTGMQESEFIGIPVSPGTAIGPAMIVGDTCPVVEKFNIPQEDIQDEIKRFHRAMEMTREQIEDLQKNLDNVLTESNHARIFDAHLLITQDQALIKEVENRIANEHLNAEFVFKEIMDKYIADMTSIPDKYLRERAVDLRDVTSRVLKNLHGADCIKFNSLPGPRIIIAHDLVPSDTASLDRENVLAFATEAGSRTSHTAIMARSMAIPAVVAVPSEMLKVKNGDIVIIDGYKGKVIVNPKPETLDEYANKESREGRVMAEILKENDLVVETLDSFRVELVANIELPEDVKIAKKYGASGIGLFRTEYMYINSYEPPSLERQVNVYTGLLKELEGNPLVVRTFDIGGDKLGGFTESVHVDPNPFLGCRAIRLHQDFPELLTTQIKAILIASAYGDIKIMFPMIACDDEVGQMLGLVDKVKQELREEGKTFNDNIEVGIMIETPSAALIAERLASRVDFFSIGTNDLVQYTLAVDRNNEKIAYLYQPAHPAILKLIHNVVNAAIYNGIWVSVCGEMAADPRYIPLLLGMGIHELSMSALSIGTIRRVIRKLHIQQTEEVLREALTCATADEVLDLSEGLLNQVAPDVLRLALYGE